MLINTLVSELSFRLLLSSDMLRMDYVEPLPLSLNNFVLITIDGSGVITIPSLFVGDVSLLPSPGRTMSLLLLEPEDR